MGKTMTEDEKNKKAWDSNAITPGTPFMDLLAASLRYWVVMKMNTDPGWKDVCVHCVFSLSISWILSSCTSSSPMPVCLVKVNTRSWISFAGNESIPRTILILVTSFMDW